MIPVLEWLSGKKTYINGVLIIVLLMLQWQGVIKPLPTEVYGALVASTLVFLRMGVAKGPDNGQPPKP